MANSCLPCFCRKFSCLRYYASIHLLHHLNCGRSHPMRFRLNFTFTFTFWVTLSCYVMLAQDFRATLGGRVLDPSASVLPRVAVTATNVDTNVKAETVSNEAGEFVFPPLVPGRYVLMAE